MFLCLCVELHLMKVELEGKLFGWINVRVTVEKERALTPLRLSSGQSVKF